MPRSRPAAVIPLTRSGWLGDAAQAAGEPAFGFGVGVGQIDQVARVLPEQPGHDDRPQPERGPEGSDDTVCVTAALTTSG